MKQLGILLFGIFLGSFSKWLDCMPVNELPYLIAVLDLRNFFGRLAIWVLLAVCISIYSKSALKASVNVFVFFAGAVSSYYIYSKFIAGFFPRTYAVIWIGLTILSPVLAFICWHARQQGKAGLIISAGVLAVLFNRAFGYFYIKQVLESIIYVLSIVILRRPTVKETIFMIGLSVVIAAVLNYIIPFHFG